ncbi:MAG: hypothetical protein M3Q89_12410, partial [Verrucomicrobiota bacterium]|nr:hypothetical protein [Verrucomicrobiota bacterium]
RRTLLRRFFARIHSVTRPALVDRLDGFFRPRHLPGSVQGDRDAFEMIILTSSRTLFAIAHGVLQIWEEAEDMVQDASSNKSCFSRPRYEARKTRHPGVTWLVVWGARAVSPLALSVTQRELWKREFGAVRGIRSLFGEPRQPTG